MDIMEYNNKQFIQSINRFWSDEIKKCTNSVSVLKMVHKRVQKLYDIQQATEKGEIALARRFVNDLDSDVLKSIPGEVLDYIKYSNASS
jgi:aspartyl/asparaginyl beta-hydroxylase (cupin superfamily)